MPPIQPQNAAPSTLADVIRQVIDAFRETGNPTPIQVGAHLLEDFGAGSGPKVLFVPEPPNGGGSKTGALSVGNPAAQVHACDVYVRAPEPSEDVLDCLDALYALDDFLTDCIRTATTGRAALGACSDASPLKTPSGLGLGLAWSFAFTRDIRHNAARWRGPLRDITGAIIESPTTSPADTSTPVLLTSPAAIQGTVDTITITATAKD